MKQVFLSSKNIVIVIFFVYFHSFFYSQAQNNLKGYYIDTLEMPLQDLRLVLCFRDSNNRLSVSLYSIDQSSNAIKMSGVRFVNDSIFFSSKIYNIQFSGRYDTVANEISGLFIQGAKYPLVFYHIDSLPRLERPQTPFSPFPYQVEEINFYNKKDKINLSGTLTIPSNWQGGKVVLLIGGSGPNDRDQTIYFHKPMYVVADYLTRHGIAVLRYDKRGVGKSEGEYFSATTFDFANDARAALQFLHKDKRFKGSTFGMLGHSEGGLIVSILSADKKPLADFGILMGTPVQRCDSLLVEQSLQIALSAGFSDEYAIATARQQRFLLDKILQYKDSTIAYIDQEIEKRKEQIRKNLQLSETEKQQSIGEIQELELWEKFVPLRDLNNVLTPWFLTFISIDPKIYLLERNIPLFALFADNDTQVPVGTNAHLMSQILSMKKNAFSSSVLPHKNHLFQTTTNGNPKEYGKLTETISEEVLRMIKNYILRK